MNLETLLILWHSSIANLISVFFLNPFIYPRFYHLSTTRFFGKVLSKKKERKNQIRSCEHHCCLHDKKSVFCTWLKKFALYKNRLSLIRSLKRLTKLLIHPHSLSYFIIYQYSYLYSQFTYPFLLQGTELHRICPSVTGFNV